MDQHRRGHGQGDGDGQRQGEQAHGASLAGLAPHPNESGTRTGGAHIQGGRPFVRVALYCAAVAAARCDKGFKAEYLAMRASGKPAKVAIVAIARKLIVAANGMLKADRPWQPTMP